MTNLRHRIAMALAGAGLALSVQAAPVPIDAVVAIANDDIILQSELAQKTALITEQLQARGTRLPPDDVLRSQILERMIIESLQMQVGQSQGIRLSDERLNMAVERVAYGNNMTLEQFRQALIAEGEDYAQVREQIGREVLLQQIQQANVGRRIRVSDQELRNYLESEQGQQGSQADYLLSHILIDIPPRANPELIQQAEKEAQALYRQLVDGADFAELATAHSDAPNALKGGDLGWRKANEIPEALAKAVRPLQAGQFSSPIRTSSGFYIVQVRDKKGGAVQLVDQTLVSHILLKPSEIRTSAQARQLISRLYKRINENGEDFAKLAKEYSDDPASGSEGGDLGWAQNGQMVPAFENMMNSTPTGQVSKPFESRFGWHILWVRDRRQQDLGEEMLESQAREAIRKRKFNEELANWLRELRAEAFIEIKR
ncbi:peptidylprolyl isomerase [Marinobacterium arenosum]|uniref:peptidylprolyl isomerase n=1 Tax=Marinobacterium arenosum TaxID=2862496 RepID=UPI001C9494DD|nr:peptidylprolyl isomerase [Marinobacterium arenosum]MBY4676077.1 peptidylprolyl isomerase [Marinobacterium arenosum]